MNISIHCPGCNRELTFPHTTAGRQARCPGCNHPVYVPTPSEELKELALAPDDQTARITEASLRAERRMVERILAGDVDSNAKEVAPAQSMSVTQSHSTASTVEQLIVGYLAAMRDSDLNQAETCLARLRDQRPDALSNIDRLATDQIPPAAVQNLPPGVYQGFLRNLRSQI